MSFTDTRPAPIDDGPDDPYAAFRVEHPREILALLKSVRDTSTPVTLTGPEGLQLSATLWTLDPDRQRLSFAVEAGDPQLPTLVECDEVSAIAYLEAIKLQADLHGIMLVHSQRATVLQAALPRRLYRFQRRGAYRVRALGERGASAQMRHPGLPEMALTLRVLDVSAGGCALQLPPDVPPLPLGTIVHGVQFHLDADTRFEAALRLQHVTSIATPGAGVRLGCEMRRLDPDAQRALQRWIDATQKRRRLLSLD